MRKVAFVVNSIGGGGAEKSSFEIVSKLFGMGYPIRLIGINKYKDSCALPFVDILDREWRSGFLETLKAIIRFRKIIDFLEIEELVLNCDLPEMFAIFAPRSCRLVLVEHANPPWSGRRLIGRITRLVLNKRSIRYVRVSNHLQISFVPKADSILIPNPVLKPDPSESKSFTGPLKRLVYVGRFSSLFKNPQVVIEISGNFDLPCLMIGEGELLDSLRSQSIQRGVKASFPGFISNPWEICKTGDLVIIPSSAEGDGLVLVEAILRGIPFLASKIPDLDKYGLPQKHYCSTIKEFEERITIYSNNLNPLIVPEAERERIYKERDINTICKKWLELLSD